MATLLPGLWSRNGGLDPFKSMQREMEEMFRNFGRGLPTLAVGAATPALNIAETPDKFEVTAEIPGVDEKDIKVSVEGNRLIISGEKKTETENKDKDWRVVERAYGAFHRAVALPFEPADDAIEAHYDKGVLHLSVKKPEQAKPASATIPIKSGSPPQG
jgi:HSP20 family protein